jgi:hypothetical protein
MKKPPAVVILLLVVVQCFWTTPLPACGIAMSIWYSIEGVDAIVLGRIERLETHELVSKVHDTFWSSPGKRRTAEVRVLETWKGTVPATMDVDLGEDYGSTIWKAGDLVVAFLQRGADRAAQARKSNTSLFGSIASWVDEDPQSLPDDPDFPKSHAEVEEMLAESDAAFEGFERWMANRWSLVHSIRFDRYSENADIEATGALVRLAVRLQAGDANDAERFDWHVTAAEHRATRSDGLLELYALLDVPTEPMEIDVPEEEESDSSFASSWEDAETPVDEPTPRATLSRNQLRRLAEGFAREPAIDESDVTMLKLLADYPDFEVDRAAASVVEAGLLLRPIPQWVTQMVEESLKRYGDDFAARIGRDDRDPRGRPIYTGEGENTLPTLWEVARRELGIPAVIPAEAPKRAEGAP